MQDVLIQNTKVGLGQGVFNRFSRLELETCTLGKVCQCILQIFLGQSYVVPKE